jgi:sugar phosphate isomerase/epimerase
MNWQNAGGQFSMPSTMLVSICVTRFIRGGSARRRQLRDVLGRVEQHPRCNILFDPSHFVLQPSTPGIHGYLSRSDQMVHVKDAEFNPNGAWGPTVVTSLGSSAPAASVLWAMARSTSGIFAKLAAMDFDGWAVLEWECCLKHPEVGAARACVYRRPAIIQVTDRAFDDFADAGSDEAMNRKMLE